MRGGMFQMKVSLSLCVLRRGVSFFEGFSIIFVLCVSTSRNVPKLLSLIHLAMLCFLPTLLELTRALSSALTLLTKQPQRIISKFYTPLSFHPEEQVIILIEQQLYSMMQGVKSLNYFH